MKRTQPETSEYYAVLETTPEISNAVKNRRRKLRSLIFKKNDHTPTPYISLFKFRTSFEFTPNIIQDKLLWLNQFPIAIDGVGCVKQDGMRTIFWKLHDEEPIRKLFALITGTTPPDFHPHITIARDIPAEQYEQIEERLADFEYNGEWICDHLTILRKNDAEESYEVAFEIPFMGYLLN